MTLQRITKGIYKWVVDNKMRDFGDIDYKKNIIRINKSKKKNTKRGDILNTIVHEEIHKNHPQKHEKTARKDTVKKIKKMSKKEKIKKYNLV